MNDTPKRLRGESEIEYLLRTQPGRIGSRRRYSIRRDDNLDERRVLADYSRAKGDHLLEGCEE